MGDLRNESVILSILIDSDIGLPSAISLGLWQHVSVSLNASP
jgi:hypothetical protein